MTVHVASAAIILVAIEIVLMLLHWVGTATPKKRAALASAQEERRHPWWLLIYIGYHIPVLAFVSWLRRDDAVAWWLFAPLTIGLYLTIYLGLSVASSTVASFFK